MSGVVAFEGDLNSIIGEYLEFNNFARTQKAFEDECVEKGKPVAPVDSKPKANHRILEVQGQLLHLFDGGHRAEFLQLWADAVPENVRNVDSTAQKLEFYVHIYFAIYHIKYNTEDLEDGMLNFKNYLETSGSSLSQTTEFLPFYALPYVPNPKQHPSYKELFSDRWVPDLKTRLEKFLTLALKSTPQPRLFELYQGGANKAEMHALQHQVLESERKVATYMKRYNRVQADYHNLISITADLVDSLEATVQGKIVSPEYIQQICLRLFSNQIRQSVDLTRPGTAGEMLRQSVMPPQGLEHRETATPGSCLDYEKIKRDLISAEQKTRGLLLQALRWKLTKSAPPERDAFLSAYIAHDILGCSIEGPHRKAVLDMLTSDIGFISEYTARLFNTVASLCEGRSYLSNNPDLLRALMRGLQSEHVGSITRENVLGCLQKLSLRRQLQSLMIDEGIISWLVTVLEDDDSLSDYTLEYSVALLMNLCLRTEGKSKCAENSHEVLKVLSDLLGHDNQEIIPYVNGALYSILAIPSIREEAKAMGMEEILRCFVKEGQTDMNRQIEFIIKQLNSKEETDDAESDEEDEVEDEEDQDAMEADLDKLEILKPQGGELHGDRLLNTNYAGSSSPTHRKKKPVDNVVSEEVLTRPVTPGQRKNGENPVLHVQPKSSRPSTGNADRRRGSSHSAPSRPTSRDINRPPTRSGSRPNTADTPREPPILSTDYDASDIVSRAMGQNKKVAQSTYGGVIKPSTAAINKLPSADINEYSAAFSSRPRVCRTPDTSGRPTSRGSVGGDPPQPTYSESLPTPRPGSGGRPSSAGNGSRRTPSQGMTRNQNGKQAGKQSRPNVK